MSTRRRLVPALLLALLALATTAAPAAAESHEAHTLAFGWLVENADAVVLATPSADRASGRGRLHETDLTVEESIRGTLLPGAVLVLEWQDIGEESAFAIGQRHLCFLRALPSPPGKPPRFGTLSGEFGVRAVPAAGPEARFPDLCRRIAATLDPRGEVVESERYRALLVEGCEDADPGVAWSAATDLVRRAEMHAELTLAERRRVVVAFERQPVGRDAKKALALAAGITGDPSAGPALVASLLHPRAREFRLEVGVALRRLGSEDAAARLVAALPGAGAETRATLLNALGAAAPSATAVAPAVAGALKDPVPEVRVEAAQALGLLARAQKAANADAPLVGREPLLQALAVAATENEQRASVWALAQLDEPEAYTALRRLAAEDERPLVKQAAERYLANPRLSLVLR